MKIRAFHKTETETQFCLIAETQAESAQLIEFANAVKNPVKTWGRVALDETFCLVTIPLKKVKWENYFFGNEVE